MYDLIITGGKVVDGTGSPPRAADLAISNGLISEIASQVNFLLLMRMC